MTVSNSPVKREKEMLGFDPVSKKAETFIIELTPEQAQFILDFYNKDNMNKLKFSKVETDNDIKKENFVYSFLSSIRQKMQSKRK